MLAELSSHRRLIVTGILVFFSMGFLLLFTESNNLGLAIQRLIVSIAFFLVIPLLYSKIVLREPLSQLGFQKGNMRAGIATGILALIAGSGVMVVLSFLFPDFRVEYQLPAVVMRSFYWFIIYELLLTTSVVLLYEVFFRGLIQLSWLRGFGVWAVVIQAGIFYGFSFFGDNFFWQNVPLLVFCPLAGLIAWRSQSLWYSLVASWLFLFLADVYFLSF